VVTYPALHADPVPAITPAPTPPFRSLMFRQTGERDDYQWPKYEIYNVGDKEAVSLKALVYSYDAAGHQVARMEFGATVFGGLHLAPGGHTALAFSAEQPPPITAVTFEACYNMIRFSHDTDDHWARCRENRALGEQWGNGGEREITSWNDPAIAKDNPGLALSALPIVVMHPFDGPATRAMASYLSQTAPGVWKLGKGPKVTWPADTTAHQFDHLLAEAVRDTEGAVAFMDLSVAETVPLHAARIKNRRGAFVAPTPDTTMHAADNAPADLPFGLLPATDKAAYPIAYPVAAMMYAKQTDQAKATWTRSLVQFLVTDAQPLLETLGFGRLPRPLADSARARLAKIQIPK
jgi:hypothetical protein